MLKPILRPILRSILSSIVNPIVYDGIIVDGLLNVVILGDSIMRNAYQLDAYVADGQQQFYNQGGVVANIFPRAVGGDKSSDLLADLPTNLAEFAGKEDNTVFFILIGTNDILERGPWTGDGFDGSPELDANYRQAISDIQSAGFYCAASSINHLLITESEPYNLNIVNPIIKELLPDYWDNNTDLPVVDINKVTYDFRDTGFIEDGIHHNDTGEATLREYIGLTVPSNINQTNAPDVGFDDVVVQLGKVGTGTLNSLDGTTFGSSVDLPLNVDGTGTIFGGVSIEETTLKSNGGRGNAGDTSESLTNDVLLTNFLYNATDVPSVVSVDVGQMNLTEIYTVGVTASRDSAGIRNTLVTVGGVTKVLLTTAVTPEIIEFYGVTGQQLNDNGISWVREVGTSTAYLSGIRITKN